jgi:hypothetical protein
MVPGTLRSLGPTLLGLCAALPGQARAGDPDDPFAPGERWSLAPPAGTLWLPRSVASIGQGELVWLGCSGRDPALYLLGASGAAGEPAVLAVDASGLDGAIGAVLVLAGDDASELFSLAQLPEPGSALRRTRIARHDAKSAARGLPFAARWTRELEPAGNAPGRFALGAHGGVLVSALPDQTRGRIRLEWLDPEDGHTTRELALAGEAARELALSEDGTRLALLTGSRVYVRGARGEELLERSLASATTALAFSGDGRVLAHGEGGAVRLFVDAGAGFVPGLERMGQPGELPVALALAREGGTLALAWWDAASARRVRLELLDTGTGQPWNEHALAGSSPSLQEFPSALALTADGRRVALGLWGQGDGEPEFLLFERGRPEPLLWGDLPGSVDALALDGSGTRLVVAHRSEHANRFSALGAVRLHDTGQRDLVQLSPARPGAGLALALRLDGPARAVLFALGHPLCAPLPLPPGELWIDPARPRLVLPGTLGTGWATAAPELPAGGRAIGLPLVIQAATLGSDGRLRLAATRIALEIL